VSISPIFYEQLFRMKVFCAAFMCLQFGFVIFWGKDFGAKAAHKMLVKLTPEIIQSSISFNLLLPVTTVSLKVTDKTFNRCG
jgi:hypothetical protein